MGGRGSVAPGTRPAPKLTAEEIQSNVDQSLSNLTDYLRAMNAFTSAKEARDSGDRDAFPMIDYQGEPGSAGKQFSDRQWNQLTEFAASKGIPIFSDGVPDELFAREGGKRAKGFWDSREQVIYVDPTLGSDFKAKVLLHEVSHALLGHKATPRDSFAYRRQEIQAETTAYLVASQLGASDFLRSTAYIKHYAKQSSVAANALKNGRTKMSKLTKEIVSFLQD